MNDANSSNTSGLPDKPTAEQPEQPLDEPAQQNKLRNDVIREIGQLVLEEMMFAADQLKEYSDDIPPAVKTFEAVRDDLLGQIQGSAWDFWAASGWLFAKLWEQYVRLYPKDEPWPDDTQAEKWRRIEGKDEPPSGRDGRVAAAKEEKR